MSKYRAPISIFALQTPEQRQRQQRLDDTLGEYAPDEVMAAFERLGKRPAHASFSESAETVDAQAGLPAEDGGRGRHAAGLPGRHAASEPAGRHAVPADASGEAEPEIREDDAAARGRHAAAPAEGKSPNAGARTKLSAVAAAVVLALGLGAGYLAGWGVSDNAAKTALQEQQAQQEAELAAELEARNANVEARHKALGLDEMDRVRAEDMDPITVYPVEVQPTAELERIADIDVSEGTSAKLDVPIVNQLDTSNGGRSLMSGCEVASLAMLLHYRGIDVTKEELQDAMPTVGMTDGSGHAGNPNYAFVGQMEGASSGTVGYSVYHAPVAELAQHYVLNQPYKVVDLTGQNFTVMLKELADGNPCWVITTETFQPLIVRETWETAEGPVVVNWDLHSVAITGYDDDSIYLNDPYGYTPSVPYDRDAFEQAWKIMGSQLVAIVPAE